MSVIARSSSSQYVTGIINNGMSAGRTYTLYAYAQAQNGTWYLAGSDTITMKTGQSTKTLSMPACHNQKYTVYHGYFNKYACGACSVAHVAEFYRGSAYSNSSLETDLKNAKVISDDYYGADWTKCPYGKIAADKSVVSYSKLYELIKTEIDAERPVIIRQTGSSQHYVVAYKYINSAQTDSDIFVLDSANLTQGLTTKPDPDDPSSTIKVSTHPIGQYITLRASASYNNCPTYSSYMTTSRS